eukprot:Em0003g426a
MWIVRVDFTRQCDMFTLSFTIHRCSTNCFIVNPFFIPVDDDARIQRDTRSLLHREFHHGDFLSVSQNHDISRVNGVLSALHLVLRSSLIDSVHAAFYIQTTRCIPSVLPPSASIVQYLCDKDRFHKFPDLQHPLVQQSTSPSTQGDIPSYSSLSRNGTTRWMLQDTLSVVDQWPLYDPTYGLELLDPQVASYVVRRKATEWLSMLQDDYFYDSVSTVFTT